MRVPSAQRSGRPTAHAVRAIRRTIEIDGVATADRPVPGRALLRFEHPVAHSFAAGAAVGYVAQAIGQSDAEAPVRLTCATAAAAYERADATAGACIAAPMPAARLSA